MVKKLFYLFIFFAPFTSFFALSGWLRLPVIINQILFILLMLSVLRQNTIRTKWILKDDLLLIIFLALVWVSYVIGFKETRSFNHSLAYTNSILFYFFLSKYIITVFHISSVKIGKIIYWSFLACSFIIIVDFIGKNYFNYSFRSVFSELDGVTSNMDYFTRAGLYRVGGVAEEPGHMAMFYNIYFGLSLYYIYRTEKTKLYKWILAIFIIAHFAMFSNAGIVLPIIAVFLIFSLNKLTRLKISIGQLTGLTALLISIAVVSGVLFFFDIGQSSQIFEEFFNKIFFSENLQYSSSGQRLKQWGRAFINFIKHPIFGNGPGFGVNEDPEGYLSVYLTILSDIGILAFIFFVAFLESIIINLWKLEKTIRSLLLFCVITSFIHLMIMADFYHAPFWILLVFIQLVTKENKEALQ
ncbi:MAG: hypothetical protein OEW87_08950 [Flavobacteriaceae bacterium]|nr:hypothetical protein [Flavobacteriaceae bacterium]